MIWIFPSVRVGRIHKRPQYCGKSRCSTLFPPLLLSPLTSALCSACALCVQYSGEGSMFAGIVAIICPVGEYWGFIPREGEKEISYSKW